MSPNGEAIRWDQVTESGRQTILFLARHLVTGGYTGEIVLKCNQGGVTDIRPGASFTAKELERVDLKVDDGVRFP